MATGYDGTIKIDTSISSKGFNTGIKGLMASVTKLGAAIGIALGIGAVVAFGKSSVAAASDVASALVGLQSVVEGTGNSFTAAKEFLNDYIDDGLVPITNATTAYKNLLMRGYDVSQIESVLNALKDSASFGRQSSLSLGQAVQSATEGLKNENSILVDNAGVTKNISLMWKDYAASIGTTVGLLTKQQKIQAEVAGIIQETRFQTGDAAKLANTYAGQISALGVSFQNLKVGVGNVIIPIVSRILPYIRAAIDALVIFFNRLALIMSIFFGVQLGAADQTAAAMDNVAESTGAAADAQTDLADSTGAAGKAAKGALAAFDQLNVLQQDSSTGSGTGSGAAAAAPALALPELDSSTLDDGLAELEEKVNKFKVAMLLLFAPIIKNFGLLVEALRPLGITIWEGLQWAFDNILVPFANWTISELIPEFLLLLAAGAVVLNSALVALKPLGIWLVENLLKPMGEWAGDQIIKALQILTEKLYGLSDWIEDHPDLFQAAVLVLGALVLGFYLATPAIALFTTVMGLATAAGTLFGAVMAFITSPIFLVAIAIAALILIIIFLIRYWDELALIVQVTWQKIKAANEVFLVWFKDAMAKFWAGVFAQLDALKQKWANTWTGIKDFTKGIINTIIDFINGMIRAITNGLNSVIRGINSIRVTIPAWIPGLGGSTFAMNIPTLTAQNIPHLATGAVIPPNAKFAAILGDQTRGTNIEAPADLIRKIVKEELGAIKADIQINFGGSLAALVRELKPYIDREDIRIGKSLVKGRVTT